MTCRESFLDLCAASAKDWSTWEDLLLDDTCRHTPRQPNAAPHQSALPQISGYDLIEEIGRGGMGVVYKARQTTLNRIVAIKMIIAGPFASPEHFTRFRNEAESVARLQHPHIVQIFEVDEQDGLPYISLEYVAGKTLDAKISGSPLPAGESARLVETLARTVQSAHEQGVVHRDLKPANILISVDGQPKITDFGLAKSTHTLDVTKTSAVLGTPAYMAPEQIRGGMTHSDPCVDVYALGVILYEALTGRPPFQDSTAAETLKQVVDQDPVCPRALNQSVSRDLEVICMKCLAKQTGDRYGSAGELGDDLGRWLRREPIRARPVGPLRRFARWCQRRPAIAALSAVLAVTLVSSISVLSLLWSREATARRTTNRALSELQREAASDRMHLAYDQWAAADIVQAERLLESIPAGLRRWEWHYMKSHLDVSRCSWIAHRGAAPLVAWHPTNEVIATAGEDGTVCTWKHDTAQLVRALDVVDGQVTRLAFSPDGDQLAFADHDGITLCEFSSGVVQKRLKHDLSDPETNSEEIVWFEFCEHETQLMSATSGGTVATWDTTTGEIINRLNISGELVSMALIDKKDMLLCAADKHFELRDLHGKPAGSGKRWPVSSGIRCVTTNRQGTRAAVGGALSEICLFVVGDSLRRIPLATDDHVLPVRTLAFSPNGRVLASGSEDYAVKLWAVTRRFDVLSTLRGHPAAINSVAFSRDGKSLASVSEDGIVKIWDAERRMARRLQKNEENLSGLSISCDGQMMATIGRAPYVSVWDTQRERPSHSFQIPVAGRCIAFSHNRRWIAAGLQNASIHVWDLTRRKRHAVLTGHAGSVTAIAFHPKHDLLATCGGEEAIRIWDVSAKRIVRRIGKTHVKTTRVAFSPDGSRLALVDRDYAQIWDTTDWSLLHTLRDHRNKLTGLEFSPDGRQLATCSRDGTAILWSVKSGEAVHTLRVGTHYLPAIAFSHDGERLIAAETKGPISLWSCETGTQVLKLYDGQPSPSRIVTHPDGRRIFVSYFDGSLLVLEP